MTGVPRPHSMHEVLVVDPDDDVRANLVLFLQLHGTRALGTRAEDDTLQRLREGFRPCVVFVDPRRVGLDAWGLVDYLRTDSVLATVPLVLIAGEQLLLKCAPWRGVRECVAKPAMPASFVAALERQCRRHWLRRLPEPQIVPAAIHSTLRSAAGRSRRRLAEAAEFRRLA